MLPDAVGMAAEWFAALAEHGPVTKGDMEDFVQEMVWLRADASARKPLPGEVDQALANLKAAGLAGRD